MSSTALFCSSLILGVAAIAAVTLESFSVGVFESRESKNRSGESIFNQIKFFTKEKKDIWMMRQNQHGVGFKGKWDRLAIVVDKSTTPFAATFYQLNPANNDLSPIRYKVRCFICHSNGPRAVRPNFASGTFPLSWREKVQIFKWNLKIKSYGRVNSKSYSDSDPIKFSEKELTETLKISPCTYCHKESGFLARGTLTRQNALPIFFLVKSGHMPPLGIPLSQKTKEELFHFLGVN